MGCDIHMNLEYSLWNFSEGKFDSSLALNVGRDYTLFGLLAGVRGDSYNEIAPPRGVPEDIVHDTALRYTLDAEEHKDYPWFKEWTGEMKGRGWHPDWHTASWLTPDELDEVCRRYSNIGRGITNDLTFLRDVVRSAKNNYKSARVVFWFDN